MLGGQIGIDESFKGALIRDRQARFRKTPTTSVRRVISLFIRSSGFVNQIFFQREGGPKQPSSGPTPAPAAPRAARVDGAGERVPLKKATRGR